MEESHEVDNAKEVPCKILESTIEHDGNVELKDGNSECVQKPTFRNALQAKRRLQAFAQQKQFFNTPNKSKTVNFSEKSYSEQKEYREYSTFGNKPKKGKDLFSLSYLPKRIQNWCKKICSSRKSYG